jgi:hypothetical protein
VKLKPWYKNGANKKDEICPGKREDFRHKYQRWLSAGIPADERRRRRML